MLDSITRRMRRHRGLDFVAFAVLVVVLLAVLRWLPDPASRQVAGGVRVIDGDSLEVAGERIRLRGIDAPELAQTCRRDGKDWHCGREATRHLRRHIGGRAVACEGRERDKHDRLLAVCRAGEEDLNAWMVEQGWAVAFGDYHGAEGAARRARRGLWAGEFERPSDWRRIHGRT